MTERECDLCEILGIRGHAKKLDEMNLLEKHSKDNLYDILKNIVNEGLLYITARCSNCDFKFKWNIEANMKDGKKVLLEEMHCPNCTNKLGGFFLTRENE